MTSSLEGHKMMSSLALAMVVMSSLMPAEGAIKYPELELQSLAGFAALGNGKPLLFHSITQTSGIGAPRKKFKVFESWMSWYQAREFCAAQGMLLASLRTKVEQLILQQQLQRKKEHDGLFFWLAGHNLLDGRKKNWVWRVDDFDEPIQFTNWALDQPDNLRGQHCLAIASSPGLKFMWFDEQCRSKKLVVCETRVSQRTLVVVETPIVSEQERTRRRCEQTGNFTKHYTASNSPDTTVAVPATTTPAPPVVEALPEVSPPKTDDQNDFEDPTESDEILKKIQSLTWENVTYVPDDSSKDTFMFGLNKYMNDSKSYSFPL